MNTLKPDNTFAEHYQLIKLVDTGGFAEVWKALFTGEIVALKIFPKLNEEGVEKVRAEYAQSKLLHTHLIVPSHFGVYDNQPYLVMKFCEGGNAADKIEKCDEQELVKCLHHVAGALTYLHYKGYVHQDIKPNNILLDEEGDYYLTDLGLSIKLRQVVRRFTQGMKDIATSGNSKNTTTGITPPCYRAPEIDKNSSASKSPVQASDIWALGATIFEIASGEVPFGDAGGALQSINPEPPNLPGNFSLGLNKIVKKCLAKEAWERPKAGELEESTGFYLKNGFWPGELTSSTPVLLTPPILSPPPLTSLNSIKEADNNNKTISLPTPFSESINGKEGVDTIEAKHKRRKSVLILLSILITVGAAWGVYFYMHREIIVSPMTHSNSGSSVNKSSDVNKEDTTSVKQPPTEPKDSDGDGVADSIDRCPKTPKGIKVNRYGCPVPQVPNSEKDRDGDGVPDYKDKCPDEPGLSSNHGCNTNSN